MLSLYVFWSIQSYFSPHIVIVCCTIVNSSIVSYNLKKVHPYQSVISDNFFFLCYFKKNVVRETGCLFVCLLIWYYEALCFKWYINKINLSSSFYSSFHFNFYTSSFIAMAPPIRPDKPALPRPYPAPKPR